MSLLRRIEGPKTETETPAASPPAGAPAAPPSSGVSAPPEAPSLRRATTPSGARGISQQTKQEILKAVINALDKSTDITDPVRVRQEILTTFEQVMQTADVPVLTRTDRLALFEEIVSDITGFGPIDPLLRDESVSEIMVNGPFKVYVERKGRLELSDVKFLNDQHVRRIIDRIISPLGRRCDESTPMVDARLPDGSRVNAIIPPLALDGSTLTVRKFSKTPLTVDDLVRFGSLTPESVQFLRACVMGRLNIIVAGGTGSGKTTLLNVLSSFIPEDERIVTVEDAAELQLRQEHVVRLETRKENIEGRGAVTVRDLVVNTLRMRPDRIVVGECRGGEALDMLQAMNTGHDGSLTTAHANSPKDTLSRLETMSLMAGIDLPLRVVREQIASAVSLIVFQERLRDGSRRVTYITEIVGLQGENYITQDLFRFELNGIQDNRIQGALLPTGNKPSFLQRLEDEGVGLPEEFFTRPVAYA
jgi:pilus assembly protein CpaF